MSVVPETTCRLCPATSASLDVMVMCFGANPNQTSIAAVLNKHFWFELDRQRDASAYVCQPCWLKVHGFHQFYLSVLAMYRTSMKLSELATTAPAPPIEPLNPPICDLQLESNYMAPDYSDRTDHFDWHTDSTAHKSRPSPIELPPLDIKPDFQLDADEPALVARPAAAASSRQRRAYRVRHGGPYKVAAAPVESVFQPGAGSIPYTFVNGHTVDSRLLYCEKQLYRLKKPIRANQRYVCHKRTCRSALFLRDGVIIKLSSFRQHNHEQQEDVFNENIERARRKIVIGTGDCNADFLRQHCDQMVRRSRISAKARVKFE